MSVLGWIGLAALAWITLGIVVFCIREREARQAISEFLLALVLGPALLTVGVFLRHRAPRATPLTAEALALWARQETGHSGRPKRERSAWVLSYRGRGLIIVRQRPAEPGDIGGGWLNNLSNRTSDVRRRAADRAKRKRATS